jgi:hypothetical protein
MRMSALFLAVCTQAVGLILFSFPSYAIDLTGAWATDAAVCDKVFAKKGKAISFKADADAYGSGFIIDGNTIRGKIAKCSIKVRKEDGAVTHLLAACSTDISLANVQFALKTVDQDRIIRLYPGMEGLEVPYSRCPIKM